MTDFLKFGAYSFQDVEAAVGELVLARVVPGALLELVGSILDEHRHEMLARRRDASDRRPTGSCIRGSDRATAGRTWRRRSRVRCNPDRGRCARCRDAAGRGCPGQAGEVGQLRQGDVDLQRSAVVVDVADGRRRSRAAGSSDRAASSKVPVRIEVAGDLAGVKLVAVGQGDAGDGCRPWSGCGPPRRRSESRRPGPWRPWPAPASGRPCRRLT